MYLLRILLLLFVCVQAHAQTVVNNKLTAAHINLHGTKASIVPPQGYQLSETFTGFVSADSTATIVFVPNAGTYVDVQDLDKKHNLLNGTEVYMDSAEGLKVNGYRCGLASGGGAGTACYILVLQADSVMQIIEAAFPKNDTAAARAIRQSLLSVVFEPFRGIDPFATSSFSIDVSGTGLHFSHKDGPLVLFLPEGVDMYDNMLEEFIMAGSGEGPGTNSAEIKKEVTKSFLKGPFGKGKVKKDERITLDGLNGYAITWEGKSEDTGHKIYMYTVLLFDTEMYIVTGYTPNKALLEKFKAAFNTFKLKQ